MFRKSAEQIAGRRVAHLYAEHSTALYRFARHLVGSREDAEDLVQSAFLALYRAMVDEEQLVNPRAWLMTVVKRGAANRYRERRHLPLDALHEVADSVAAGPSDAAEMLSRVRATLWALPEAQHEAFVLRHWSGLSYEEIASVMETTPSAVESLLVRARAAVMADQATDGACALVRVRLSSDQSLAPLQARHLETCRRCSQARSRLEQATELAVAIALAPRAHVAQALASTIPGFTAKAAMTGAAGSGAAAPGAASAGKAGLIAKGAITVLAVAGAVGGVAHTHIVRWPGSAGHAPRHGAALRAAGRAGNDKHLAAAPAPMVATIPVPAGFTVDAGRSVHRNAARHRRAASHIDGATGGTDTGGSPAAGQGTDGQGSDSQSADGQGADSQGSGGGGSTSGDGSGSDSSGRQGPPSGQADANGESQQQSGSQQ